MATQTTPMTEDTTLAVIRQMSRDERIYCLAPMRALGNPALGSLHLIEGRWFVIVDNWCCVAGMLSCSAWEVGTPTDRFIGVVIPE